MKIFAWLAVTALLAPLASAGCSNDDDDTISAGGNSVTGTVGGLSLTSQSAVGLYAPLETSAIAPDGGPETINGLIIEIADKEDSCSAFHGAATTILSLSFYTSPPPGTYSVDNVATAAPTATQVVAAVASTTATCEQSGDAAIATGGTVTITAIDASSVSGTVSLTFDGGSLTGSFTAPICSTSTDVGDASDTETVTCNP